MMRPYYGGATWISMGATMLVFWGGAIALSILALRAVTVTRAGDPALATLRRRLAEGEISQDEFEKTKRILQG